MTLFQHGSSLGTLSGAPHEIASGVDAPTRKYWAFISYSHHDARIARRLQRTLETYRLPRRLVGQRSAAGVVPAQLKPIFLDRDELQAGTDLQTSVREALAQSRFLIVVCSPAAARSPWVNQEVVEFKKLHGETRVLAVIAGGEPFASRLPGREAEECFPPALRAEVTPSGLADGRPLEPIAADVRAHADGPRRGTLKLIAGMIGVGADELIQRDARRRLRQLTGLAAGSLAGMAVMTALAVSAVRSRNEAHHQRAQGEDLIEFMLGDLRKKLVPVGRLDVLDGVGEKALAYYAQQDAGRLDASALGHRSRALHLIGEMHDQRGQLDLAETAFRGAAETTAQLLRRSPDNARRVFDHAQSVYWVGYLAWRRGQARAAEEAFRNYVELADRLVRLDDRNPEWQAEPAFSRTNVGVVCLDTGRSAEALENFERARATWQRLILSHPARTMELANCLGWIAKAHEALGDLPRALETHKEKMRALEAVPDAATNQLVNRHRRVIYNELARLELALGQTAVARAWAVQGLESSQALVSVDPENKSWQEQMHVAQTIFAEAQLAAGDRDAARATSQAASAGAARLLAADPKVASWQVNLRGRVLWLAAQVCRDEERSELIAAMRDYLAKVQQFATADRALTRNRDLTVAQVEEKLGALLAQQGRADEAAPHWRAVVARLQDYDQAGDWPALTLRATAHARLGEIAEARALAQRVEASPYRHPAYADLIQQLAGGAGLTVSKP